MPRIYKEIIKSKTGSLIPVLSNGKTLESIYNPERDAERKIESLKITENICLVLGLGSGLLIKKLLEKNPEIQILCAEYSEEDIQFLKQIPLVNSLFPNIKVFPKENTCSMLLKNYIPSLYGNLKIIEQTNYFSENEDYFYFLKAEIQKALNDISKDYSVQAHFGKIWQHNILNNYKFIQTNKLIHSKFDCSEQKNKTCAILAAGPTLDEKIPEIIKKREEYFILATDTAFQAAEKQGLICDAVITLDAQNISEAHFLKKLSSKTFFIIDLCSSPSIISKIKKQNQNILFFSSGHPLSLLLQTPDTPLTLCSGSGTVTIAALDFAIQTGFNKIQIFGADFSYPGNKPYAKGTYLDSLYNRNSSRIEPSEKTFSKLMFRTELIEENGIKTSEILKGYRNSFEEYLIARNIPFTNKQNVYVIEKYYENISKEFSIHLLSKEKIIEKFTSKNQNMKAAFLPFMAFLQRISPETNTEDLYKKAEADFRRYLDL